jgi:5-amino-6-(5-phosphoribosylamino)uracil reductase
MADFEILFDQGEESAVSHPGYRRYGRLGFPAPPEDRPWCYANFVQSIDGIASFKGKDPSGAAISQSVDDRWLMDLLRAHADAVMVGKNTLVEEQASNRAGKRGPVFRIEDAEVRDLRRALGRGREINIIVSGEGGFDPTKYAVFDGERVDAVLLTTEKESRQLAAIRKSNPQLRVVTAGKDKFVDLGAALSILRRDLGIRYLLCEGGPTLYGYMSRAGLIDEKFLTVSPVEIGQIIPAGQEPVPGEVKGNAQLRPTTFNAPGFTRESAPWWTWVSCRKIGDHEFNRYRRRR